MPFAPFRPRLFALLPLLAACEHATPPAPPPRPALTLTVGAATAAAPTIVVGEVRPRYESAQAFRIGGKIVSRAVEVGALVKKGQLLAQLDTSDTDLTAQAAQAQLRSAEADLNLAQAELNRHQQLFERHFISASALDIQKAQFDAAAARVKQYRAQASVNDNQTRYTQLLAERNGVITSIDAEPGQVVGAGQIIARIAVPESREVSIAVPESQMSGIAVNSAAEIRLWINPAKVYHGNVREVAPAADSATRTFAVRVALNDADQPVRLGMTAGVRFYHQNQTDIVLPLSAVSQYNGETVVWRIDPTNQQVQPQAVQIGVYREDGVTILAGIQTGDQLVAVGVHALTPGQQVRPQPITPRR